MSRGFATQLETVTARDATVRADFETYLPCLTDVVSMTVGLANDD